MIASILRDGLSEEVAGVVELLRSECLVSFILQEMCGQRLSYLLVQFQHVQLQGPRPCTCGAIQEHVYLKSLLRLGVRDGFSFFLLVPGHAGLS